MEGLRKKSSPAGRAKAMPGAAMHPSAQAGAGSGEGPWGSDPPLTVCKRRFGKVLEAGAGEVSGDGGSEQPLCPRTGSDRTPTAQHCRAPGRPGADGRRPVDLQLC